MTRTYSSRWKALLKRLDDGELIVTASNRQADFLKNQFRYYKSSHQQTTWLQPQIYTIKQWTHRLFEYHRFHFYNSATPWTLLSDNESRIIWEQLVAADEDFLLDTRRTAERARKAISSLADWNLLDNMAGSDEYTWREETARLKKWHGKITKQCEQHFWIQPCQLNQWLTQRLEHIHSYKLTKTQLLLPDSIYFLGFQETVPSLLLLQEQLQQLGHKIQHLKPDPVDSVCIRREYTDPIEELIQTALWAKQKWLENPKHRIGIVIPNLNQLRDKVQQTFKRLFCASELLSNEDRIIQPFDISLGLSLASYRLIDHALTILKLLSQKLDQEELVLFLQSSYCFSDDIQPQMIEIANSIRRSRQATLSCTDILYHSQSVKQDEEQQSDELTSYFEQLEAFQTSTKMYPSQWSLQVTNLLNQLNWCNTRKLTSVEYQTKEAWHKQIDRLAIYDHLTSTINWSQFLSLLKRTITETLFQPQTGDCSIQIMGVFEATFLTFDSIHICGIDNRRWPESAKPNPFIPYEIQKQYDMPSSSAERELQVSQDLYQLMSTAAPEVIFSHCKGNGEESLSVSPLIESLPVIPFVSQSIYQSPAEKIYQQQAKVELLDDHIASPLLDKLTTGGTKLLQDIARCQFSAFAHHRLNAKAHETPKEGIDALDRGNLIHHILEQCWLHIFDKQQSKLIELQSQDQILESIRPVIQLTLEEYQKQQHEPLSAAILAIEKRRLERLLLEWFKVEASRPTFVVRQVEQSIKADIDGHILSVQLDRVDEISDQSLAIIDYKTGDVRVGDWFSERPEQPQLPMYSVVLAGQNKSIGALLYGKVKHSECTFAGIAEDKSLVSGVKSDFTEDKSNSEHLAFKQQVDNWKKILFKLMADYSSGKSAVTPKNEKACQYCDLHGLCRIGESS